MPSVPKIESIRRSPVFYVLLAAVLYVFIKTYSLVAPILLSFLLILLISLAANPLISRIRSFLTGGRTFATGLAASALVVILALTGATLLGMLTIGLLVFLFMWPILGIMDALVLGLIAGVLEAIPFIGPILSAVPALLLALGKGGMTPLWVVIAYLAIQALENNVILPAIMSRGMKLHPVAVIFSMLLCVAAFGVLGVLVAAPLVAIVDIMHDELFRKRFLSSTTNADLDSLARKALHETVAEGK